MKIYLEERLKESGISKDELAKRLGISNSSLTKKLNGPSRTNLQWYIPVRWEYLRNTKNKLIAYATEEKHHRIKQLTD